MIVMAVVAFILRLWSEVTIKKPQKRLIVDIQMHVTTSQNPENLVGT